jgi:hypothetical protein
LVEQAVARAPGNRELHELAGSLYLKGVLPEDISEKRDAIVNSALEHFQAAMAVADPAEVISQLKARGCMVNEIGRLWPGSGAASRLRRAEFYLEEEDLHLVDMELKMPPPADPKELSRWHMLLGALDFKRGEEEPAVNEWCLALDTAPAEALTERGRWMASHLPALDGPLAEKLATAIERHLPQLPALNQELMWKLVWNKNWLAANKLLAKTAYQSPYLYMDWAEAALGMLDFDSAESRAEAALQRAPRELRAWHRDFMERLKAQRKTP